jgi:UDP-N-acetylglucosamine 2-epimerase (non-hydrolysing)
MSRRVPERRERRTHFRVCDTHVDLLHFPDEAAAVPLPRRASGPSDRTAPRKENSSARRRPATLTRALFLEDAALNRDSALSWARLALAPVDDGGGSLPLVLIVAGTRPECIKLAPVVAALSARGGFAVVVVNSGQHRDAVRQTFASFGIRTDIDLAALPAQPNLAAASAQLRAGLRAVIARLRPAIALVQGDTLTAYAGARAARDAGCLVGHIEAGLRTDSIRDPFPEEWFRRRIARSADLHFAPSDSAVGNLLAEGFERAAIHRVGNTGIDALRDVLGGARSLRLLTSTPRRQVLVTLHRRENCDDQADVVCDALIDLVDARPGLSVLFPVHPNPRIARRVRRRLGAHPAFELALPLPYRSFIRRAAGAALIISDSGGIQEEAPHLGVPLLVPRANTERPESVASAMVRLVRVDRALLAAAAGEMLDAPRRAPLPFDDAAPYGAGDAAQRIMHVLDLALRPAAFA